MNDKKTFVEKGLSQVICCADSTVSGLKLSDDEETVTIHYYDTNATRQACIACDSFLAIILDVTKECLR